MVGDLGGDRYLRPSGTDGRAHRRPPLAHMNRRGLDQPHVAIKPRPFIGPRLAEADIAADDQDVVRSGPGEIGDIDLEGDITALVRADDEAVEDHQTGARHAIALQEQTAARVLRRQSHNAAIPADAGRRPNPAQRLEALKGAGLVGIAARRPKALEGQIHRPVVRQGHPLPILGIKRRLGDRGADIPRFGICVVRAAKAEVLRRIAGVAEVEPPIVVERRDDASDGGGIAGIGADLCGGQQDGQGRCATGLQEVTALQSRHGRGSLVRETGPCARALANCGEATGISSRARRSVKYNIPSSHPRDGRTARRSPPAIRRSRPRIWCSHPPPMPIDSPQIIY